MCCQKTNRIVRPKMNPDSTRGKVPQGVQARIRFGHVHFYYSILRDIVLHGLAAVVQLGTCVASLVPMCTKPTVIQLTERFSDPRNCLCDGPISLSHYANMFLQPSEQPIPYLNISRYCRCVSLSLLS